MGGNSGGGGNGGRSGGGSSLPDNQQPGEVFREANKANALKTKPLIVDGKIAPGTNAAKLDAIIDRTQKERFNKDYEKEFKQRTGREWDPMRF